MIGRRLGVQLFAVDSHMCAATVWDRSRRFTRRRRLWRQETAAHVVMSGERWIVLLIGLVVSSIVALAWWSGVLQWCASMGLPCSRFTAFAGAALLIWGAKFIGKLGRDHMIR